MVLYKSMYHYIMSQYQHTALILCTEIVLFVSITILCLFTVQFYQDVLEIGELAKLGKDMHGVQISLLYLICIPLCTPCYHYVFTSVCAVYFNDIVVGGVCCRIETEGDQRRLYIMTLGVLAPYRRLGIGTCTCTLAEKIHYTLYTVVGNYGMAIHVYKLVSPLMCPLS